ncbi:GDSL-type esterase/lipase family protein [Rhodobacteraceae bacterium DSL-40]|uniref:GDSL-type esterase/lipase family protein n=1 Tax=Amaricoccus sp. B4 TaxID=3368557 RepID=UPI000DAD8288
MRACFIGDSFTHGVGDAAGLGWRGRVVARMQAGVPDLTAYDLGIRRDTSGDIRRRWEAEALARLAAGFRHRLVFSFGTNDCADDGTGAARVPMAESLGHADAILARAARMAPTLLIGPPPVLDDPAADARIARLEPELATVAGRHGVPFLPVFEALRQDAAWRQSAAAGDGTHPDGAGYAALAARIWDWPAFRHWAG